MSFDPIPYPFDGQQLFFLHIPKTAGTTFTEILNQYYSPDEVLPATYWSELFELPLESLDSYAFIAGHFNYNMYMLLQRKPVIVTFLREPLERALSHYEQMLRVSVEEYNAHKPFVPAHDGHPQLHELLDAEPAFNNFTSRTLAEHTTPLHLAKHLKPERTAEVQARMKNMKHTLDEDEADMLVLAKQRLQEMPFFGITERFSRSMHLFSHIMGWPAVTQYEKRRVARRRISVEDLPQDVREKLIERNQLDIELYSYAQTLFEERLNAMLTRLLFMNYQRRPVTPATGTFLLEHALPGTGWYPAEPHPVHGMCRWTGPETSFHLDLPVERDGDAQVTLYVIQAVRPDLLNDLILTIDEADIPLTIYTTGEGVHLVLARIPSDMINSTGPTRLSFHLPYTIPSREAGIAEGSRPIGLQISKVTLSHIEPVTYTQGWYLPEKHPHYGLCRWTGPNTMSEIEVTGASATHVVLTIIHVLLPELLESIRVQIDSEWVQTAISPGDGGTWQLRIPLASEYTDGVRIRIYLDRTVSPQELGISQDPRSLGIQVSNVYLVGENT